MAHKSRGRAAVLLLFVMLPACANFEPGWTKLRSIKTIGIVSAIGDEFTVTHAGLNELGNEERHYPIDAWGLDDLITGRVGEKLAGRFEIEPVSYQRNVFAAAAADSPFAPMNMLREDPLKTRLRREFSAQPLDALIVIVKAKSAVGSSHRTVSGIGAIAYRAALGSYDQLHAIYEIDVIDGHTFESIESRQAAPLDSAGVVRLAGPSRPIDENLVSSTSDLAQSDVLRQSVTDLIDQSLSPTLRDLRLLDGE